MTHESPFQFCDSFYDVLFCCHFPLSLFFTQFKSFILNIALSIFLCVILGFFVLSLVSGQSFCFKGYQHTSLVHLVLRFLRISLRNICLNMPYAHHPRQIFPYRWVISGDFDVVTLISVLTDFFYDAAFAHN